MSDQPSKHEVKIQTPPVLSERARRLFKILVEDYLYQGTPIGSKRIAEQCSVKISSATVRNVMADLDDRGLVQSPHTSAGKIPTDFGLRFFVDSLISIEPLDERAAQDLRESLPRESSPNEIIQSASKVLAEVSSLVGIVSTPRPEQVALRQIQFLQLGVNKVLAIVVVNEREVQNRIIETARAYTDIELLQATNYINSEYGGLTFVEIRKRILASMQADQERMNELMQVALDVSTKAFDVDETDEPDCVVTGETNLLGRVATTEEFHLILEAFQNKRSIIELLDRCIDSEGTQLFIGRESGYPSLDDYTMISTQYKVEGNIAGALGVIGPMRLPYQKVIPLVEVVAQHLGQALERSQT